MNVLRPCPRCANVGEADAEETNFDCPFCGIAWEEWSYRCEWTKTLMEGKTITFFDWDDYVRAHQFRAMASRTPTSRRWWLGGPDPLSTYEFRYHHRPSYGEAIGRDLSRSPKEWTP